MGERMVSALVILKGARATMFDLESEDPIPLKAVARRFGTHYSTVLRWHLKGTKAPNGDLVRLEARRVGRAWWSSWAAVERFSDRLTPDVDRQLKVIPRTPPRTERDNARAKEALA